LNSRLGQPKTVKLTIARGDINTVVITVLIKNYATYFHFNNIFQVMHCVNVGFLCYTAHLGCHVNNRQPRSSLVKLFSIIHFCFLSRLKHPQWSSISKYQASNNVRSAMLLNLLFLSHLAN